MVISFSRGLGLINKKRNPSPVVYDSYLYASYFLLTPTFWEVPNKDRVYAVLLGHLGEVKTGLHHGAAEVFRYACRRNPFHTYNDYVSESVKVVIWEVLLPSQDNISIQSTEKW